VYNHIYVYLFITLTLLSTTYMLKEIHKIGVVGKIPWKFLHEYLRQQRRQSRSVGSSVGSNVNAAAVNVVIIINVIATPSRATSAAAALQLRRGGSKIQAIARDHD